MSTIGEGTGNNDFPGLTTTGVYSFLITMIESIRYRAVFMEVNAIMTITRAQLSTLRRSRRAFSMSPTTKPI
jgi:hypothetical protein